MQRQESTDGGARLVARQKYEYRYAGEPALSRKTCHSGPLLSPCHRYYGGCDPRALLSNSITVPGDPTRSGAHDSMARGIQPIRMKENE